MAERRRTSRSRDATPPATPPGPNAPAAPAALPVRPPRPPRGARAPPTPPSLASSLDAPAASVSKPSNSTNWREEVAGYPKNSTAVGHNAITAADLASRSAGVATIDKSTGVETIENDRGRQGSSASWSACASGSITSTSPAIASSSAGGSVSSTRAPSPATTGTPTPLSAPTSARRNSGSGSPSGQLGAPASWKFKPQDEEHRLREQGLGAGHLKGRRSNLARIREIQGGVSAASNVSKTVSVAKAVKAGAR